MVNFIYKTLGSLLFARPNVQYIQAKNLNLYFKNSKNPQYHLLNLTQISLLSLEIDVSTNDKENVYSLIAKFVQNDIEKTLNIAQFENKKEAETALHVVRTKLFSPEKKIIKVTAFVAFVILIWSLIVDTSIENLKRTQLVNSTQGVSLAPASNPLATNNQQNLEALLQQAIAQQANQVGTQQQVNVPQPTPQAPTSASDFLIKSLN